MAFKSETPRFAGMDIDGSDFDAGRRYTSTFDWEGSSVDGEFPAGYPDGEYAMDPQAAGGAPTFWIGELYHASGDSAGELVIGAVVGISANGKLYAVLPETAGITAEDKYILLPRSVLGDSISAFAGSPVPADKLDDAFSAVLRAIIGEAAYTNYRLDHLTDSGDPDNPGTGGAHDEFARALAREAEEDAGAAQDDVDELIVAFHAITDPADRTKILEGAVPVLPQSRIDGLEDKLARALGLVSDGALPDELPPVIGGASDLRNKAPSIRAVAAALNGKASASALDDLMDDVIANEADIEAAEALILGNTNAIAELQRRPIADLSQAVRDLHAALREAYLDGEITRRDPFVNLLRGTPDGAGEIVLSLDDDDASYNANIGGRRGITGLGMQADKVIYCELSNPTEHALYIRIGNGSQAFYGIHTDAENNRWHTFYDPDENVGLDAGRRFVETADGNVPYLPGDRVGYAAEVRPGGNSLWIIPAIFRAAGGNPISGNDIEFDSANAVAHYDPDAILIHGGDFVEDLWIGRHSGASIRHSQIAYANFALDGLGLRTEGEGLARLTMTAPIDFTGGLFVGGVDLTTLIDGGEEGGGDGISRNDADARYRLKSSQLTTGAYANESITEAKLHADVAGGAGCGLCGGGRAENILGQRDGEFRRMGHAVGDLHGE